MLQWDGGEIPFGSHDQQIEVLARDRVKFFFSRRENPAGTIKRISLPRPLSTPIARKLHKRCLLNKLAPGRHGTAVFSAGPGETLVPWTLAEDDEIIFRYHFLVGFSSTLKLSTIANLGIAALATSGLGCLYSVAKGPGLLLFKVEGAPQFLCGDVTSAPDHVPFPGIRLVAWERSSIFEVAASGAFFDIYLSESSLARLTNTKVLLTGGRDAYPASVLRGFFRRLWRTLLPVHWM